MSTIKLNARLAAAAFGALAIGTVAFSNSAAAAPLPIFPFILTPPTEAVQPPVQSMPQAQEEDRSVELPARLRRQVVAYPTREAPGTVIIDTPHTYLYLVLGNGQAMRYGIGVGRDGFTWSGTQTITEGGWSDWTPPPEMVPASPICRATWPGPGNPLSPRDVSRRHCTASMAPTRRRRSTHVSSGCLRLTTRTSPTCIRGSASVPR